MPVCPTCMSFGTNPASTAALEAPTVKNNKFTCCIGVRPTSLRKLLCLTEFLFLSSVHECLPAKYLELGGWILAEFFFFFCVFMVRDRVVVYKLTKKERGQYLAILTEKAWSIKDLLFGRTQWVIPSGQDSSILHARVANHRA